MTAPKARTLVALTSFTGTDPNGVEHQVRQGDTVAASHPAVKGREELFQASDSAAPRTREAGSD
jgi:hypothetical protein